MSLITYEDARPWARAIRQRTGIRDKAGAMPPWYIEKNIGIQQFKHDPVAVRRGGRRRSRVGWTAGAPRGNPADMPPPIKWADDSVWSIGTPDLIVESPEILVKANSPDWWGELEPVKIPLDEDRYVAAIEMKEVNDIPSGDQGRETVGAALCVPSPDLVRGGARGGRRAAREPGPRAVAGPRSGQERRRLRSARRPAS